MQTLNDWVRLCFTFESRVTRKQYLVAGIALSILKFSGDALMVWVATGQVWSPTDYLSPVHALLSTRLVDAPPALLPLLALWSLPFLWIAISLSMRRAINAGHSAWWSLCIFVPYVSYLFMVAMCTFAGVDAPDEAPERRDEVVKHPGALLSMAAGIGIGLGMLAFSVNALEVYGTSLFLGTPFVMGAVTAFLYNRRNDATLRETIQVVAVSILCVAGVTMMLAEEGAICLAMAAPLALALAAMGATLGRRVAQYESHTNVHALLAVALLPVSALLDANRELRPTNLREVQSSIEIDASAQTVWQSVIAFPPLEEPTDFVFRLGVAYPKYAEIRGSGIGAIRYCVFSTGAFVEPITGWEPGQRLSFNVDSSPPPLTEWSPFADVTPPHLDGYFRSRRGEFRLVPLANGRMRLEGSTWYEMRMYPEGYWALYGDVLIGRIHDRVLQHIKRVAESARRTD